MRKDVATAIDNRGMAFLAERDGVAKFNEIRRLDRADRQKIVDQCDQVDGWLPAR